MRALVTGGAGFVGRALVKRLLADGCRVTVIDDLSAGTQAFDGHAVNPLFMRLDVRMFFRHSALCDFDTIFHCAAIVGGRLKIDGDPLAVATDLAIDSDLFSWLARVSRKPKKVVYFSSSAVYPVELQKRGTNCPLVEEFVHFNGSRIGLPDQTYGFSKLSGEYLAGIAAHQYGIPVVIYRPFSGYGATQAFDYPFPSIVRRVMNREDPITVWGSGQQLRDFIHIDDLVEAVFATMDRLSVGEVLNLGSGVGTSFTELAQRTAALLDRPVNVVNDAAKPEGVFARVADVGKLHRFYRPKVTLDEGIRRVYEGLTAAAGYDSKGC